MDSNDDILTQIAIVLWYYPIIEEAMFNLEKGGTSYMTSYGYLITEQDSR